MKKTIYIHIGAHKTGTTAIQRFLSSNRENLIRKGFFYPGDHHDHHFIPHSFQNKTFFYSNPKEKTLVLFDEVNRSDPDSIILSSEAFEFLAKNDIFLLKETYLQNFSVKIIYYVRRQDEQIESRYNEMVKGSARYSNHFSEFLNLFYKNNQLIDYYRILSPWREAFGLENIIVRVYEEEQMPNGIFSDFLKATGLEIDDTYVIPREKINQSLQWDLVEFIRLCNIKFKDDMKLHRFLVKNLEKVNLAYHDKKIRLLSPQERHDITELHAESNKKIAREYLGRDDGTLFFQPLPDPNEPWEPYGGLTVEKFVPIFTQMLYNLDMKYRNKAQSQSDKIHNERFLKCTKVKNFFISFIRK